MAQAIFLNATPLVIAVSLNSDLDTHKIKPLKGESSAVTLEGWSASIAATPSARIFGANSSVNTLVIFSKGSTRPLIYTIRSSVSVVQGLLFYILGSSMVGVDQAGSDSGIFITSESVKLHQDLLARINVPDL